MGIICTYCMSSSGGQMHGRIGNGRGDELLTTTEVARRFHVSPKTVRRWALAGKVNALMTPGGQRRFSAKEIDALLRSAEEPDATAGAASSAPASGSPWLPVAPPRQDSSSL